MKFVFINKKTVTSMDDLYRCFAEGFHFPEFFGANLDALYDCLTDDNSDRVVFISDISDLEVSLGAGLKRVRRVLADASAESPSLRVIEIPD